MGRRGGRGDDPATVECRRFLATWKELSVDERIQLFVNYPGLWYAHDIHASDDHTLRVAIETRLLAGESDEAISANLNTIPETIAAYEGVFYNIRDRIKSRDWIQKSAIYPAMVRGADDNGYEFCAKLFGYFGGPVIANEILHMCDPDDRPSEIKDVSRYWERQLTRTLKRRSLQAAQFFEINKFNVVQLFAVVNDVRNLEHTIEQGDTNKTELESTAIALMSEIKFVSGLSVQAEAASNEFDGTAVELRSDESIRLGKGEVPQDLKELANLTLPPPRKRKKEEAKE